MSGIGAGAGVSVGVGVDIGVSVAVKIAASAIASSTADIEALIEELKDREILDEDTGPVTCTECGETLMQEHQTCPHCSAIPGEQQKPYGSQIDDENNDDIASNKSEPDGLLIESPSALDNASHFEDLLLKLGLNRQDAEYCGQVLAKIWEKQRPLDENSFKESIEAEAIDKAYKEQVLNETVLKSILVEFESVALEEEENRKQSAWCEIKIFKDSEGKWSIVVEDPLQNIILLNPKGKIALGDNKNPIYFTAKRMCEVIKLRRERLTEIANELIRRRSDFFDANTVEKANEILETKALSQKVVANSISIPESTLSRWCQVESVMISTPHGIYALGDFFRRVATTRGGRDLTSEGVREAIKEAKKSDQFKKFKTEYCKGLSSNKALLKFLKEECDIDMEERTLSYYNNV